MDINELKAFSDEFVKIAYGWGNQDPYHKDNDPKRGALLSGIGGVIGGGAAGYAHAGLRGAVPMAVLGGLGGASGGYMGLQHRRAKLMEEQGIKKVALTLGDVELIKKQPETTYGKVREAGVGATKGALAGSGVAALLKKNPRVGAAIGAGAYLMDRNVYGHGEKLASAKLAGIGLPTNSLAFTPGRAKAAKQFTSAMQTFENPSLPGGTKILGGKTGRIRANAGPRINPPSAGNVV